MCLWRPQISFIRMGNRRMIGKWLFKSIFRILGKMLDQTCSTWNRMSVICRLVMSCLVLFASFSTFASFAKCNSDSFVWSYKENCFHTISEKYKARKEGGVRGVMYLLKSKTIAKKLPCNRIRTS